MPPVVRVQRLHGGARVELDLSDRAQAQAYLTRRYEPEVVALLARSVQRGGVLFDVGANIGLITFAFGNRRSDVSIVAFEPDAENADRWRRNLEMNPRVSATLEQMAVGAEESEVELIRGDESGWSFVSRIGQPGGMKVPMVSLDAYAMSHGIRHIDALKLDVEGYEPMVLEGASLLLREQSIRFIVCEVDESLLTRNHWTRSALVALLAGHGYEPRVIPGMAAQRLRARSWETGHDVLFVRA
jgi:FkbM family methyltransferase